MTEQSEAIVIDPQDDDDDTLLDTWVLDACCVDCVACEFCAVVLLSSSLGSSGLLGFSGLPGVSGSFGSLPEPAPPISPPPPGGQKGQIHDGRLTPKPPVPPFHLSTTVSPTAESKKAYWGKKLSPSASRPDNNYCSRDGEFGTVLICFCNRRRDCAYSCDCG